MTRWLVTGAAGMLGRDLVDRLEGAGQQVTAASHRDLDITDPAAVGAEVDGHRLVVNLAAWTDVDAAETHEDQARLVNAAGPRVLAEACSATAATLVHVSTDYVFSGAASAPYSEDDPTDPVNAYGRTKRDGEEAVREVLPDSSYVVRTSWLYGEHGPNFVATIARLAREREHLDVVDDQRGQPTWTRDVATRIIELVHSRAPAGVYHATNSGETTWFGLARAVFDELGLDPERVRPTTSAAYPRPAPRPAYSVLGHGGWERAALAPMRDWRDALRAAAPDVLGQPRARLS